MCVRLIAYMIISLRKKTKKHNTNLVLERQITASGFNLSHIQHNQVYHRVRI